MSTDGAGTLSWSSGTMAKYLYVTRTGTSQTISSGTWSNRDVIFNTVNENSGVTYNSTTGIASLEAGVTYRITAGVAWAAAADYYYQYAIVDGSTNTVLSPTFEETPPTEGTDNVSSPAFDWIYTPLANQTVKLRITGSTAGAGEVIRGNLSTFMSVVSISNGPIVSQGGWTNVTGWSFGGTTTAPTSATSSTRNYSWRVDGKMLYMRGFYYQNASAGAANGTGEYLVAIPGGYTINTTATGTATVGTAYGIPLGTCSYNNTTTIGTGGIVLAYDTTRFKLAFANQSGSTTTSTVAALSATNGGLASSAYVQISWSVEIPIL
jgi:hypothetical protein